MEFQDYVIPNMFRFFETVMVIIYWFHRKVFSQFNSSSILYILTLQALVDIYVYFTTYHIGEPLEQYDQMILTFSHLIIPAYVIAFYYYRLIQFKNNKNIQLLNLVLLSIGLVYFIFIKKINLLKFNINLYLFVLFTIFISITNFFLNFINEKKLIKTRDYLPFWVTLGFFMVYIGVVPILFLGELVPIKMFHIMFFAIIALSHIILLCGILITGKPNVTRV